uniref:Uncharacterized protein n=1 Tax=Plectus sambesii TaxID=2011161 RepID=A0A914UQD9_9BILA
MDEKSRFSNILNIAHKSRMCGHRFRISQVVCHSVLPLLLTASQYGKKTGSDSSSELILWKVYPVGPLCKSGGVRELARVTSNSAKAFTGLAWVPAILPSSTLGSVCNSPSSCFVASDGLGLRVYQAVVDARGLLAEIYSGKTRAASASSSSEHEDDVPAKRALHDTFTVVSTQSTAKPGCVLQLAQLSDAAYNSESVLLLHVFHERLIVGEIQDSHDRPAHSTPEGHRCEVAVIDRSKSAVFSDCYYVVLIEKDGAFAKVHMWSLEISSQPAAPIKRHSRFTNSGHLSSPETDKNDFFPTAEPHTPSAAQLFIASEKVCTQILSLPEGVVLLEASPAAGHLSSSSLYPACRAPYVLMTACSDDHVRFWRCCKDDMGVYSFREWRMISDTIDSAIEMDGVILGVASAHSSRLACAYEPAGTVHHHRPGQETMEKLSVEIAVYECESTGGVEWTREDSLHLRDIVIPRGTHVRLGDFDFNDVK